MPSRPEVSIVVVSWNTERLLRDCLESLLATAASLRLQTIVVDNASSDGSVAMVRELFPDVELVENDANVGFAAAVNRALPRCTGETLLLLNPDAVLVGDALERLLAFLRTQPHAAAVGPKVVHPDGRLRVLSAGWQPTLRRVFNHFFWLSTLFPERPSCRGLNMLAGLHDDRERSVEWIAGSCLLVRREVVERIGPLDERWFMYSEDWEWCQRMLDDGWTLHHLPDAVVEHRVGAAAERNEAVSTMWVPNLRRYVAERTRPSRIGLAALDAILVGGLLLRAVGYRARGLVDRRRGTMWKREARKFASYARAALAASRGA